LSILPQIGALAQSLKHDDFRLVHNLNF
jgi:hypothetical protein